MILRSSFNLVWYLLRRLPFHGVLPIALPCHTDAELDYRTLLTGHVLDVGILDYSAEVHT